MAEEETGTRPGSTGWASFISSARPGASSIWWYPPPGSIRSKNPRRCAGFYPGQVSNILGSTGFEYLDPADAFANSQLEYIKREPNARETR